MCRRLYAKMGGYSLAPVVWAGEGTLRAVAGRASERNFKRRIIFSASGGILCCRSYSLDYWRVTCRWCILRGASSLPVGRRLSRSSDASFNFKASSFPPAEGSLCCRSYLMDYWRRCMHGWSLLSASWRRLSGSFFPLISSMFL